VRVDFVQMRDLNQDPSWSTYHQPRINWCGTPPGRKTVVRAGYNRYVDPGWFQRVSFLGGKDMRTETFEFNPATGQYDILYTRPGRVTWWAARTTPPPRDEISLQVERELFTDFSLAANGLYREFKYMFEDGEVNRIWNQDGGRHRLQERQRD